MLYYSAVLAIAQLCFSTWLTCGVYAQNVSENETEKVYDPELGKNITDILNGLLSNYNATFRPQMFGEPIPIEVDIRVLSMGPVSEQRMEMTLDCYFRQSWVDERLKFSGPLKKLTLNAVRFLDTIWKPDTYIKNGKNSYLHRITVPNKLLRLGHNGQVYISQRLTINARCPMYLQKFPMDVQACPLQIGSLGYTTADLVYHWKENSEKEIVDWSSVRMAQYRLLSSLVAAQNQTHEIFPDSKMTVLLAHFKMERQQGYYLLQIYVPCTMIVSLSWVSFWINKDASPARVSLGVMTVLTMCALGLGGRSDLPKVSYSTALDTYISICFAFVFLALIEYAVINYANRKYWKHKKRGVQTKKILAQSFGIMASAMNRQEEASPVMSPEDEMVRDSSSISNMHDAMVKMQQQTYSETEECVTAMRGGFGGYDDECELQVPRADDRALLGGEVKRAPNVTRSVTSNKKESAILNVLRNPYTIVDSIDDYSKLGFPLLFALFNMFYWCCYIYWMPDEVDDVLMNIYNRTQ